MIGRIVTLGEVLLRLSPPNRNRLVGSPILEAYFGGSEANVAVALSQYGVATTFVTKVPHHELGDAAIHMLRGFGVDVSHVVRGGDRLGVYYLENGYSVRPSRVIYDRKNSSMANAHVDEFALNEIFSVCDVFHVSGITLGLSENSFRLAKAFMQGAKDKGLKVSFDFNYRSKLWSLEDAQKKFEQVLEYVDIAFMTPRDATEILGIKVNDPVKGNPALIGDHNPWKSYDTLYRKVLDRYTFDLIASSIRTVESASTNRYQGLVFDGKDMYASQTYRVDIVDRVGSGDAFAAGFLYSYLSRRDRQYAVEFATASGALKHTMAGDALVATPQEVESLFHTREFHVQR